MEAIPALQFTRGYWSDNQAFGGSKSLFQQKEAGPSFWQMHSKNKKINWKFKEEGKPIYKTSE